MNFSRLLPAVVKISTLVDLASQSPLTAAQFEELRTSVETLETWPPTDPGFIRARKVTAGIAASGIFSSPSKPPTMPLQILSDCAFLTGYADSRMAD